MNLVDSWLRLPRQLRFVLCGGFNTAAGFCIFASAQLLVGRYVSYLIIALAAHVVAVVVAYATYRVGVFRTNVPLLSSFFRFSISQSAGVLIGLPGLYALVRYCGLHPIVAQAIMIVGIATLSYFLHSRFSFRPSTFLET